MKTFPNKKSGLDWNNYLLIFFVFLSCLSIPDFASASLLTNLVGTWQFEEGSGTTINDLSGNSNNGSISGATWVSGKTGGGLYFDGNSNYGTFSLTGFGSDFSEGTISMWVNANWNNSTSETFIHIYVDAQNYISISKSNFNNLLWRYSANNTLEQGSKSMTDPNGWHMLSMTFSKSGEVVKYYFDGASGASDSTNLGVWTGTPSVRYLARSTSDYGEATIDDVRIYNRVLNSSEIAELYTAGSSVTAPVISSISSSVDSVVATVNWITDKVSSSTVNYGLTSGYGLSTTSASYVFNHSLGLTNLSPSTTYHYQVVSADPNGNQQSSSDYTFTTSALDETAPTISSVASSSSQTTATFSWTTNESATSKVAYGLSSGNYTSSLYSGTLLTSHSLTASSLTAGTRYYYVVVSGDSSQNIATSSEYILTTASIPTYSAGGITIEAEDSEITSTFVENGTYVSSSVATTDPDNSGTMTYYFNVSDTDNYVVDMLVDAGFDFDVYASVDGDTPTRSYFIGEATSGYEWRTLYWTESSTGLQNLSPGNHTLVIYGGTANIKFDKVRIEKMSEQVSQDFAAPSGTVSGSIAIMNSGLDVSQQTRSGCYYTSPYYVCGIRTGLSKLDMVVNLTKTLSSGTYYVFVKGTSAGGYNVSIANASTSVVIPNASDEDGVWTSLGSITTASDTNYVVVTTNRTVGGVTTENALLYGIYITDDPNVMVSDTDVVINSLYPTVMDDSTANKGNLVQNSGFEVGVFGDWSITSRTSATQGVYHFVPFSDAWDQTVSYSGTSSMRLVKNRVGTTTNQIYQIIYSKPYHLNPNKKYTLSFWAKTSTGQTASITYGLVNSYTDTRKIDTTGTVTSTWQRFSVTGYALQYPSSDYKIRIFVSGGDTSVWIDDIQLEEGLISSYESSQTVELGLHTDKEGNIFYNDDTLSGSMKVYNSSANAVSKTIYYEVYDYKNNIVKSSNFSVSLSPNEIKTETVDLDTSKLGAFRIIYWVSGQNQSDKEMTYSIIPRPIAGSATASVMGTHTNISDYQLDLIKRMGISNGRSLSTADFFRWYFIEPTENNFNWYDDVITQIYNSGVSLLGTLDIYSVPSFAVEENGYPNLTKWGNYVHKTVDHYKAWVNYWEIENEPNFHWSASYYAQMLKTAVDEIESVDPTAKIVAMGGTPYSFMQDVVTSLESQYPAWDWRGHIDAFSTHAYPGGTPAETVSTEIITPYSMPVWNTETGAWDFGSFVGPYSRYAVIGEQIYPFKDAENYYRNSLKKPEAVVQNFVKSIGAGMTKYYYYDSRITDSPFSSQPTFINVDDSVSFKGIAYAIAGNFIDYSTTWGDLGIDSQVHAYLFERNSIPTLVIWTKDLSNKNLTTALTSSNYHVYDLMGNSVTVQQGVFPIGRTPIYIVGEGISTSTFRSAIIAGTLSSRSDSTKPNVVIANAPRDVVDDNVNDNIRITWFAVDETSSPEAGDLDEEQTVSSVGTNPNALLYSYRLQPSLTWSSWSANTVVDYSNLDQGVYTFDVRAKDEAGNISDTVSRSFSVGSDAVAPVISSISSGSLSTSGATITWTTDEASDSQVEYGLSSSYTSSTTLNTSMVTSHSVTLSGLSVSTLYHYRVVSKDAYNNTAYSSDQTFTTSSNSSSGSSSGGGGGGGGGGAIGWTIYPSATSTIYLSTTTNPLLVNCINTVVTSGFVFSRDLYQNIKGDDVRELQKFLNSNGYPIAISGDGSKGKETTYFGPATKQALIKFQNFYSAFVLKPSGLVVGNGYFGKATRAKVNELNKKNSTIVCVPVATKITSPVTVSKSIVFSRDLTVGSRGEDVRNLQKLLNSNDFIITPSGDGSPGRESDYFGNLTQKALVRFQIANNISPAIGYFGPKTRAIISKYIK